jgi:hypothetical protein
MHEVDDKWKQNFTGELKGKRPLERPRLGWEDNNKMGLKEIS